jgi:hypothetical protein
LALPFFGFSEPIAAQKNKYGTTEWTLWDRFEFKNDPTLKDIITWFQKEHKLDISMVSQGVSMLWSSFVGKKKVRASVLLLRLRTGCAVHPLDCCGAARRPLLSLSHSAE